MKGSLKCAMLEDIVAGRGMSGRKNIAMKSWSRRAEPEMTLEYGRDFQDQGAELILKWVA